MPGLRFKHWDGQSAKTMLKQLGKHYRARLPFKQAGFRIWGVSACGGFLLCMAVPGHTMLAIAGCLPIEDEVCFQAVKAL